MRLIVATNNRGKLGELRDMLPPDIELLTLADAGLASPEETGATFAENALLKARAAASTGFPALADDSGLEVDALDGAPGVHSARYAGVDATDADNIVRLLRELSGRPRATRRARFRSEVALVVPGGPEFIAGGTVEGHIVDQARGSGGFGYDPIFEIDDADAPAFAGKTMAELTPWEKNRVSHRSRAYRALLAVLRERGVSLSELMTRSNCTGR